MYALNSVQTPKRRSPPQKFRRLAKSTGLAGGGGASGAPSTQLSYIGCISPDLNGVQGVAFARPTVVLIAARARPARTPLPRPARPRRPVRRASDSSGPRPPRRG